MAPLLIMGFLMAAFIIYGLLVPNPEPTESRRIDRNLLLIFGFGWLPLLVLWLTFGIQIRWNESEIHLRRWFFKDRIYRFKDVERLEARPRLADVRVTFTNQRPLSVGTSYSGANELLSRLAEAVQAKGRIPS